MMEKRINHFSGLVGIDVCSFDAREKEFSLCQKQFCKTCPRMCDYRNIHLFGIYESVRWDGKYIYYCPMDLIFIATPIIDEYNLLTGGVIVGPIIMGESEDYEIGCDVSGVPNMDTARVNDLAEVSASLFSDKRSSAKKDNVTDFLNAIYRELELLPGISEYPIELEKRLQSAIAGGDEKNAKEYLNRLLGEIFFRSRGDFKVIKARSLELVVLLSRSAIEGGADIERILALTNDYHSEINSFDTTEKLSVWLSGVINRFIGYIFDLRDARHSVTLRKMIRYIKSSYNTKITLEEISEHVGMSKSYVSKIFNEGMGMSISAYVNKTRVEKSKRLLRDTELPIVEIANLTGFEDQSYFTKQFKAETGLSPKEFRENN